MELNKFYNGSEFEAYEYFGAHTVAVGTVFRTFAPAASAISVLGEFNDWKDTPMHKVQDGKIWEVWIENAIHGQMYKYRIYHRDGSYTDHADPYGFWAELRPATASIIYDLDRYQFEDGNWMQNRRDCIDGPLNIYELHLGSWKRKDTESYRAMEEAEKAWKEALESGEENPGPEPKAGFDTSKGWYRYEEIADHLIPYLEENGYNSVEFMPLNEYPADESWGYQATGFFSATARYGEPDGLRKLVDRLHAHNISVILDVVTVHFAVNDYGLWNYDGTPLYEYPNSAVGYSEWGSCNFIHYRGEVRSFLQSAGDFWLSKYHFDGLRFDAIGNLIYWQGDKSRGPNHGAIGFLKRMNEGLKARHPRIMLIAEDSTAYPNVTAPVYYGGMGFDYKWDMGWMNDTLDYFKKSSVERQQNYYKLNFSMEYFYNEHYLLPFSHDEVVHGKATIAQKMYGDYETKFPQARAMYLYMYTHPGKKLNFMGNELGQLREWDEKREPDWDLLKYPKHDDFHRFMKELNRFYADNKALWEKDYDRSGFEWIEADDPGQCIYIYRRKAGEDSIICMFNFSEWEHVYTWKPGVRKQLTLLFDTNSELYGGTGNKKTGSKVCVSANEGYEFSFPAFSGRCYLER